MKSVLYDEDADRARELQRTKGRQAEKSTLKACSDITQQNYCIFLMFRITCDSHFSIS